MNAVPAGVTVAGTLQRQAWIDRVLPPVERVRPGLWSIPTPFPGNPLRYALSYAVRRVGLAADLASVRHSRPDTFEKYALAPDRFLVDGERPLGPGSGLVTIWTPGHTPGHVCFFDTVRNLLLTGDHLLPRISPNISPSPFDTTDALGDYLGSPSALSGLAVQEVLPAHEYRFRGLQARIAGLRAHHETRLGEVMAELHGRPGSTTVKVAAALSWSRPWEQMQGMQRRLAVSEAYAHLVHLERTGYAANAGGDVNAWRPLRDAGPRLSRPAPSSLRPHRTAPQRGNAMRVITGLDELRAAVGGHLGYSDYQVITQADIDAFAALSGDDQWIHTDVERAASGPFGRTIAHGLLTLSIGPRQARTIYRIDGMTMGVNYGYDKIRFPAPVPVDSKVRVGATLSSVTEVSGGVQVGLTFVWEVAGGAKPACVAEMLIRYRAG